MTWNLFLDDERNLEDVTWAPWHMREKYRNEEWMVARNRQEVTELVDRLGFPSFVSFDHDLGAFENGDGYEVAKYLVDLDFIGENRMPDGFSYYVHSQNPIGKSNIEGYLGNYMRIRNEMV